KAFLKKLNLIEYARNAYRTYHIKEGEEDLATTHALNIVFLKSISHGVIESTSALWIPTYLALNGYTTAQVWQGFAAGLTLAIPGPDVVCHAFDITYGCLAGGSYVIH